MRCVPVVAALVLTGLLAAVGPVVVSQGGDGNETGNQTQPSPPPTPPAGDGADAPADGPAQGPTQVPDKPTLTVNVFLRDSGCAGGKSLCIDLGGGASQLNIPPGSRVTFHVTNVGGTDHDLTFTGTGVQAKADDTRPRQDDQSPAVKTPLLAPGDAYDLVVDTPASGSLGYVCSVPGHAAAGMSGQFIVGGAAETEKRIEDYGVKYWAYWVGVISFVIVFAVLFVLYFVFRYGDTAHALDQRTGVTEKQVAAAGAAGMAHVHDNPLAMWVALLVGVAFVLLLIIAVILGGNGA